jgi:hypothetical protein
MKTQRFAAEMEKIASVKMRALEAATLAVPGGVIGLAYAKSQGKTRKFDQEDLGGLVAGGVAGAAAALTLSATGRLGVYRNKLSQFMQSKKVVDGPTQMTRLTMAERPKWIKEQIKAVDAQDWDNEYFQAQAKKQGFIRSFTDPATGKHSPEKALVRAKREYESAATRTPRSIAALEKYIRPEQKLLDEVFADLDASKVEIRDLRGKPGQTQLDRDRIFQLEHRVRELNRGKKPIMNRLQGARSRLSIISKKRESVEAMSSTKELKKIEAAHEKAIAAAKSQTWEDVDKKYFGLLG